MVGEIWSVPSTIEVERERGRSTEGIALTRRGSDSVQATCAVGSSVSSRWILSVCRCSSEQQGR